MQTGCNVCLALAFVNCDQLLFYEGFHNFWIQLCLLVQMVDKQMTDKWTKKKQPENPKKSQEKIFVQLSIQKVPDSIRNALLSDKTAPKKKRADSSDIDSPLGASPGIF